MFAGFDIGGTHARLSLFDSDFTPIIQKKTRIREVEAPEDVARLMCTLLNDVCAETNTSTSSIISVGVGIAAQLDATSTIVINAPNLGWFDCDFTSILTNELSAQNISPQTVLLVNDLNAILYGECQQGGALEEHHNALAVYVGTGVGGALLIGNKLITGQGGNAGEIGHCKVVPSGGKLCGCGEYGCVEAYIGGIHLEFMVSRLLQDPEINLARADALFHTHQNIQSLWSDASDKLALVVANACTLLNPGALLLGGGVLEHCPNLRDMIIQKITNLTLAVARKDLEIKSPKLDELAGMLGAATLAAEASGALSSTS